MFLDFPTDNDKELVADYLAACIKQENIAVKTKRVYIVALAYLCRHLKNKKSLRDITAKDLTSYLDSFQKTQDEDRSIMDSTQRTIAVCYMKFFKWLAYPDLVPQERKHLLRDKLPQVIKYHII
jgi:site-specific recombinase XerD